VKDLDCGVGLLDFGKLIMLFTHLGSECKRGTAKLAMVIKKLSIAIEVDGCCQFS
jgi:hypothetical protein